MPCVHKHSHSAQLPLHSPTEIWADCDNFEWFEVLVVTSLAGFVPAHPWSCRARSHPEGTASTAQAVPRLPGVALRDPGLVLAPGMLQCP